MGCDIHFVVERNVNGKWIGLFGKHPRAGFAGRRDYAFFAELSSVRGDSEKKALGIPEDRSELARYEIEDIGQDGHSHSWMPIREFSDIAITVNPEMFPTQWDKEEPWEPLFGKPYFENNEDDKIEDYRIVFWFDN